MKLRQYFKESERLRGNEPRDGCWPLRRFPGIKFLIAPDALVLPILKLFENLLLKICGPLSHRGLSSGVSRRPAWLGESRIS